MSRDPDSFRAKAREYALKAQGAKDDQERRTMTTLARSHVLLEVSARWLASTDNFLDAVKSNRPWPGPDTAAAVEGKSIEPIEVTSGN